MKTRLMIIFALAVCTSHAATRYVNVNSTNPTPPYTTWATAATVIQDAVDAALPGDEVVVTNGVYETGGRAVYAGMTNRVAVTKPLTLRSVNGPDVTMIRGYQVPGTTNGDGAVRCVYLTNGASLSGFTLTNGATRNAGDWEREQSGGGVWCESATAVVSNCVVVGNSAQYGGGAYRSTLNKCRLTRNSAVHEGGGAAGCTLIDCTLTANSAQYGGGASWATLYNCTITGNSAGFVGGGAYACRLNNSIMYYNIPSNWTFYLSFESGSFGELNYCCTTPLSDEFGHIADRIGNITNTPGFVDAPAGNFRLQSNSPCINAGRNAYAPTGPDFDDNPRIVGGTVDIGSYEFQSPQSTLSYAWLQRHGIATDGSADFTDPDGDGHNNWQEWRAWTVPTDSTSVLRLLHPSVSTNGVAVQWQSVSGQTYFLERSTNIGAALNFIPIAHSIAGQPGSTTVLDTNAANAGPFFYRIGIKE